MVAKPASPLCVVGATLCQSVVPNGMFSILARFSPPKRSEALARYQAALKLAGDPSRGTNVFAKNCQTCHQHQGQGHRVGPDLSGIAGRAPEALLIDIVDPTPKAVDSLMRLDLPADVNIEIKL